METLLVIMMYEARNAASACREFWAESSSLSERTVALKRIDDAIRLRAPWFRLDLNQGMGLDDRPDNAVLERVPMVVDGARCDVRNRFDRRLQRHG